MAEDKIELIENFSSEEDVEPTKTDPIGKVVYDLLQKPDYKQGVVDTQREVDKEFFSEVEKCVQRKPHSNWKSPWYVIVLNRRERTMINVVRRQFFGRQSLPTPEFDQTVFRYYPSSGNLEFIWCVPDKNTTLWMHDNPLDIPDEQKWLQNFVFEFINGTLYDSVIKKYPESGKEKIYEKKVVPLYSAHTISNPYSAA